MDESLKLLLQQINNNISDLRGDHNIQVENINVKLDSKISDLRNLLDSLGLKISEIQRDYIKAKDLESIKSNMVTKETCKENINNAAAKKEELSLKKLTLITGCISAITSGLITAAVQIAEILAK